MRAWVIATALTLLKSAGWLIYQKLWQSVIEIVILVENEWSEPKSGKLKKQEAVNMVRAIIKSHNIGNWANRWIILYFVELVIESVIDLINERIGHCWVTEAERVRDLLKDRLFFIR